MRDFKEIYEKVQAASGRRVVAVAAAEDDTVLMAVVRAEELGLCDAILVGDAPRIEALLSAMGKTTAATILDEKDPKAAAVKAADLVRTGKAHMLMKGLVDTASLLRAVLNKETGLRKGGLISHVAAFEVPGYDRMLFVTDAAMNTYPTLAEKKLILENAAEFVRSLGVELPKVAVVCAVEVVNEAMQATVDAAMLAKMNDRGQIKGCIVDGPLALDNALSLEAAVHKGIKSPVAGLADIFLMPNIEAGNVFYKALNYTTEAKSGGILMGASAPVIVTSRADSFESKVNSIAMAVLSTL